MGLVVDWQQGRFLVGNVIAFAPVGMFVGLFRPGWHTWRRTLVTGLAISQAIEGAQLALSLLMGYWNRVAEIGDLILKTGGVLLGYGAFRVAVAAGRAVLPAGLVFWER